MNELFFIKFQATSKQICRNRRTGHRERASEHVKKAASLAWTIVEVDWQMATAKYQ